MNQVPRKLEATDTRLSRSSYNELVDAVTELQTRQGGERQGRMGGTRGLPGQLLAYASADRDVRFGEVMAVSGRLFPQAESEKNTTDLKLTDPTPDSGNVVVAIDPIPVNGMGLVAVAGLAWCEVNIVDPTHTRIGLGADGTPATIADGGWGWMVDPAPIASNHPGTGNHWCLVRLPVGGGVATEAAKLVRIASPGSGGAVDTNEVAALKAMENGTNYTWATTVINGWYPVGDGKEPL